MSGPTYARGGGEAGEVQTRRLGALVTAADLTAAFRAACTTAGVLAVIAALYGLVLVICALGLLLLTLSYGGH